MKGVLNERHDPERPLLNAHRMRSPASSPSKQSCRMALALLTLCIVERVGNPQFFRLSNGLNLAQQVSIIGIMAVGMTFVIIAADIDLSVGSTHWQVLPRRRCSRRGSRWCSPSLDLVLRALSRGW